MHFAAAYSTRLVLLELLGAQADIDAEDEYGCLAIHLAEQNENKSTYTALQKWKFLVPKKSGTGRYRDELRSYSYGVGIDI